MRVIVLGDRFHRILFLQSPYEEDCVPLAGDVCPPEVHFPSVREHRQGLLEIMRRYRRISNLRFIVFAGPPVPDPPEDDIGFCVDVFPGATLFDLGCLIKEFQELLGIPVGISASLKIESSSQLLRKYRSELLGIMARYSSISNLRVIGFVAMGDDVSVCEVDFLVDCDFVRGVDVDDYIKLRDEFESVLGVSVCFHSSRVGGDYGPVVPLADL